MRTLNRSSPMAKLCCMRARTKELLKWEYKANCHSGTILSSTSSKWRLKMEIEKSYSRMADMRSLHSKKTVDILNVPISWKIRNLCWNLYTWGLWSFFTVTIVNLSIIVLTFADNFQRRNQKKHCKTEKLISFISQLDDCNNIFDSVTEMRSLSTLKSCHHLIVSKRIKFILA